MNEPENDTGLDRVLRDAVSDIHPHGTTDDIRDRAATHSEKVIPMYRRWIPVSLAAAAAMVLVIGGTLWLTNQDDDAKPPIAGQPTGSASPTDDPTDQPSPSEPPQGESQAIPVYFAGETPDGPRLFREFQRTSEADLLLTAANTAAGGAAADPDYRSDWPADTTFAAVSFDGVGADGLITVELKDLSLHDRPAGMTEEAAQLAIDQIIYTVQGVAGARAPVQFRGPDNPIDTVLGVPTSEPLAAGEPLGVLSNVQISSPSEGAVLSSGFEVTGVAATFEANVPWKLMQGDVVVEEGFTTAEECCTLSPYSFTVDAPPGDYTLVVTEDDPSGGEGPGPTSDTRNITIE